MTGTKAGATADEIAKRHREKIARLERSAVQWEAGAAGERATGEVLAELQTAGWFVLHDLAWPGRQKANIDHVVVGPGGIFVIDTKNWSGSVEVRDGVLRQNGRSRESAVDGVRRAVAAVQPLVPEVPVQPVLSLHGDLTMQELAGGVIICSTSTLREMLESRPAVLEPADVQRLGSVLESALTRPPTSVAAPKTVQRHRSARTSARSGPSLGRLVAFVLMVALLYVALATGAFTSATQWVGDHVSEILIGDPTEQPADESDKPKGKRRPTSDRPGNRAR